MSVKPRWAELLVSGAKCVEIRKSSPGFQRGDRVLLYASSPQKALIGWVTYLSSQWASLATLKHPEFVQLHCVPPEDLDAYLKPSDLPYALHVYAPVRETPIPLASLRDRYDFKPTPTWQRWRWEWPWPAGRPSSAHGL